MLLLAVLAFCAVRPVGDPDVWFHMAFGREILDHGHFPRGDLFSYTVPGREWISSGWLASLVLQGLYKAFGPTGIILLVWGVVSAAYLLIYAAAVRHYGNRGSILLLLVCGVVMAYLRFSPRPDLFSQVAIAVLLLVLLGAERRSKETETEARPSKLLWLLPPLFLLWGNLHVGFIVGLEVLAIYMIWRLWKWRRTRQRMHLLALIPCAVACAAWMLNPYGPDLVSLVAKNQEIPEENRRNMEWMPLVAWPPGAFSWEGVRAYALPWDVYAAIGMLGILSLAVVVREWRRIPLWHAAILLLFTAHAVYQRRQLGLAALVLPLMLAPHAGVLDAMLSRRRFLLPGLIVGAMLLVIGLRMGGKLAMPGGLPETGIECRMLPCRATEFFKRNPPPPNLYNTYAFGGYLLYFLSPETKVYYDGRLDVYGPEIWNEYWAVEEGRLPLEEVARRRQITTFFIDTRHAENPRHLAHRLSATGRWKLVYFDDAYAIFTADGPSTRGYLEKHSLELANPFAPDSLIEALKNPAQRGRAMEHVQRALAVSEGCGSAHALAAVASLELGNRPAAAEHLKKAQEQGISVSLPGL